MDGHDVEALRDLWRDALAGLDEQLRMIDAGELEADALTVAHLSGAADALRKVVQSID